MDNAFTEEELCELFDNDVNSRFMYADNTYNYNAYTTNDIDYKVYERDNKCYVIVKFHLCGDVRCNYTDCMLLEFDSEYAFLETFTEITKFTDFEIDGIEFYAEYNMLSEGVNVWNDTNEIGAYYTIELDELIEEIKKEL